MKSNLYIAKKLEAPCLYPSLTPCSVTDTHTGVTSICNAFHCASNAPCNAHKKSGTCIVIQQHFAVKPCADAVPTVGVGVAVVCI